MSKEKLSRKEIRQELREPDIILEKGAQIVAWGRQNTRTVMVAGGAVLAVLVGVGSYRAYESAQRREANVDLARALSSLAGPDIEAATVQLDEVAGRWGGTSVGRLALALAANADVRRGALDEASQVIASAPTAELPDYLRQQLALLNATVLEEKGELDGAAEGYAAAAQISGPYTADALLGQARLAQLGNDPARVTELYRQVYDQFPDRPDRDRYKTETAS